MRLPKSIKERIAAMEFQAAPSIKPFTIVLFDEGETAEDGWRSRNPGVTFPARPLRLRLVRGPGRGAAEAMYER